MINLRYPESTDLEVLMNARNSYKEVFGFTGLVTPEMQEHWYSHLVQKPSTQELFVISHYDDTVIGTIGYQLHEQSEMEVGKIMLIPKYRGLGLFSSALSIITNKIDHTRLFLYVKVNNQPAINAYQREGFVITGLQSDQYIMDLIK